MLLYSADKPELRFDPESLTKSLQMAELPGGFPEPSPSLRAKQSTPASTG